MLGSGRIEIEKNYMGMDAALAVGPGISSPRKVVGEAVSGLVSWCLSFCLQVPWSVRICQWNY